MAYGQWTVVTPSSLSAPDRQFRLENFPGDCPGVIKGKFTGEKDAYAINLVKRGEKKALQQVILFTPRGADFDLMTISPSSSADVVGVIRKFAPGRYKSADGGKSITVKTDTVGLSEIDAGTVVYYWNGTHSRSIVTSQ